MNGSSLGEPGTLKVLGFAKMGFMPGPNVAAQLERELSAISDSLGGQQSACAQVAKSLRMGVLPGHAAVARSMAEVQAFAEEETSRDRSSERRSHSH
jgi:hypothetical protein